VGVIDGVLFAVGGDDGSGTLKSVEAYRPSTEVLDYNDTCICLENMQV